MTEKLKHYCRQTAGLPEEDLALIDVYFHPITLRKKAFLWRTGEICSLIGFVSQGAIRHYFYKEGEEKTCGISIENMFFTDYDSLYNHVPTPTNSQAIEDSVVLTITRPNLQLLYQQSPRFESFGRMMAEKAVQTASERAASLSCDTPEERYLSLMAQNPQLFRRVPQKYIASMLGISPESLSRIRKRILSPAKILT
ncbi:Crp/Fnr family transcriptional regulator [Adhaeribacter arboris]|uniref:Crp/Fnr family transcriptional regulator n=1 Tax=Adhaeribacter arboris TaxID=2072846 RepID=A0A2T2YMP8_9BACT|nr:Crp/Fnr family transcriptional regulator [Adhaeribacter arboris]PSR56766.1 Crp/Fnr family transcriptional regulator [Adhaeribacter arboris]